MMNYYEKSSVGAAEINLVGRKANQANIIRNNIAYHNDHAAQRDDEETVSAASTTMAHRRENTVPETKKQAKALRGRVFDDMNNHFGYQRVDPSVRSSNTSLHHLGSSDMCFGDLDFSADAAALLEQSDPTPPNEQRSPLPMISDPQPDLIKKLSKESTRGMGQSIDMMCFGDLDFAADAAALFEQSDPTPPNEQRSPLPMMSNSQPALKSC